MSERVEQALFILWISFMAMSSLGGFHHFLMMFGIIK